MGRELRVDLTWTGPVRHEEVKRMEPPGPRGLYVVVAGKMIAGKWNEGTFKLLDIGQADDIYRRIAEHEREDCWHAHARGSSLLVRTAELSASEYEETARESLVCCLRASEQPPCGTACNDEYRREDAVVIANVGDAAPLKSSYSC